MRRVRPSASLSVFLTDRQKKFRISRTRFLKKVILILKETGFRRGELSLVFVGDREMRRLHREFLGKDRATDVLAFPPNPLLYALRSLPFLGEVVVSVETARRKAPEFGNRWGEELLLYVCHGLLHLKGYRDESPRERRKMETKQKAILRKILWRSGKLRPLS